MPQNIKMIKKYTSTLLKWAKCPKILKNEQHNSKLTKMPLKSKKSSVFWHSLGVFFSFSVVLWVFCLFLRFQWYFGHFISFRGYCGRFRAFWSFSMIFGYFWHSWCILFILAVLKGVILEVLVYLLVFWYFGNSRG